MLPGHIRRCCAIWQASVSARAYHCERCPSFEVLQSDNCKAVSKDDWEGARKLVWQCHLSAQHLRAMPEFSGVAMHRQVEHVSEEVDSLRVGLEKHNHRERRCVPLPILTLLLLDSLRHAAST
jgi:hypothetical protein